MELLVVLAFPLGFALLNAVTYIVAERRGRAQWVRDVPRVRDVEAPDDAFRRGDSEPQVYMGAEENPRAPLSVRAIAMWSIGMGQMFVPGLAFGLLGVLVNGTGIISVPGLILAFMIWRIGPKLLRADPTAPEAARRAATIAFFLNAMVVVAAVLVGIEAPELWPISVGTCVYALVSVLHGLAMRHAADKVEALWIERGYWPAELPDLDAPKRRAAPPTLEGGAFARGPHKPSTPCPSQPGGPQPSVSYLNR